VGDFPEIGLGARGIVRGRWAGPAAIGLIFLGVLTILGLNLDLGGRSGVGSDAPSIASGAAGPGSSAGSAGAGRPARPAGFREYPIGDEVEKNAMRIAAVWLPPVQMQDEPAVAAANPGMIHLEADIHAAEGNPQGFPRDEFVPYLNITYTITPLFKTAGGTTPETLHGALQPMVARDGWHYGATVLMPGFGRYQLVYHIEPPAAGRHSDPATGVAPFWPPFDAVFEWDYQGTSS